MTQVNGAKVANLSEMEKALGIVRALVGKNKTLGLVETLSTTGFSYFAGKKRLCKVLKTKRGVVLEINVALPKDKFKGFEGLEMISAAQAQKKHLGTMKHIYRSAEAKKVQDIMMEAITIFKVEMDKLKQESSKAEQSAKKEEAPTAKENAGKTEANANASQVPVAKEA